MEFLIKLYLRDVKHVSMMYDLWTVVTMNDLHSTSSGNEFFSDDHLCEYGVDVQHFRDSLQYGEIYSVLTQQSAWEDFSAFTHWKVQILSSLSSCWCKNK
jgi:hypothetical protein